MGEHLTKVENNPLYRLLLAGFFSLHHKDDADDSVRGGDVQEHGLLRGWRCKNGGGDERTLEVVEGSVGSLVPDELVRFLQYVV